MNWPAWHPELELKAEHLLGLEDYLIERSRILDEGAHGIDWTKNWDQLVEFNSQPGELQVKVSGVRGVTPAGQPVSLDLLEATIPDADKEFIPASSIDLFVEVNGSSSTEASDNNPKMRIRADLAVSESFSFRPNCLHLGRFTLPQETGYSAKIDRPMPRRLCAFGPIDSPKWQSWVSPLGKALDNLFAAGSRATERSPRTYALLGEVAKLRFEFPFLAIPVLVRRLRMLDWLAKPQSEGAPNWVTAAEPLPIDSLMGENLPEKLADLLPKSMGVAELGPSLRELLDLLAVPVGFQAPIAALRKWQESLQQTLEKGFSSSDQIEIEAISRRLASGDPWIRAVIQITLMNTAPPGSDLDLTTEATSQLDKLYAANSAKGPSAGPMAFYWLASAAVLKIAFPRNNASAQLIAYCQMLSGQKPKSADRLTRYYTDRESTAKGVSSPPSDFVADPQLWWTGGSRQPGYSGRSSLLRIWIAGNQGSGKSTLTGALLSGSAQSVSDSSGSVRTTVGRISSVRRDIEAEVTEIDIDQQPPGLPSQAAADLLLLTITPTEIARSIHDKQCLDGLKDFVSRMLASQSMAAILYTKADEYGVIDEKDIRLAEGQEAAGQLKRVQDSDEKAFEEFRQGTKVTHTAEMVFGGLRYYPRAIRSGESATTRQHVLAGTADLWITLLRRPDVLLNGYFIATAPREDYLLVSKARRGTPQLIADLVEVFGGGFR